jgi:hypothetical protein
LKIWIGEELIYNEESCCCSSGSIWFDEYHDEHIESGVLYWLDEAKFNKKIALAVKKELDKIDVCCGGCI